MHWHVTSNALPAGSTATHGFKAPRFVLPHMGCDESHDAHEAAKAQPIEASIQHHPRSEKDNFDVLKAWAMCILLLALPLHNLDTRLCRRGSVAPAKGNPSLPLPCSPHSPTSVETTLKPLPLVKHELKPCSRLCGTSCGCPPTAQS